MYFWDVNSLKRGLASRGLSSRDSLIYLLLFIGHIAFVAFRGVEFNEPGHGRWAHLEAIDAAASCVLVFGGTGYCYYRNGGARGAAFIDRYVSLSWVVGVRFLVGTLALFVPVWVLAYMFVQSSDTMVPLMGWFSVTSTIGIRVLFYYRMGRHIADVANTRSPAG